MDLIIIRQHCISVGLLVDERFQFCGDIGRCAVVLKYLLENQFIQNEIGQTDVFQFYYCFCYVEGDWVAPVADYLRRL